MAPIKVYWGRKLAMSVALEFNPVTIINRAVDELPKAIDAGAEVYRVLEKGTRRLRSFYELLVGGADIEAVAGKAQALRRDELSRLLRTEIHLLSAEPG